MRESAGAHLKLVGPAVQNIALAVKIYQNALARGLGEKLDGFPIIADKSPPRSPHQM
jgi:ornithine cyclodeaminase/alanine dehydrogenase-like protein (mu-crystallin family)